MNNLLAVAIKPFIFLVSWVLLSQPLTSSHVHVLFSVYSLFRKFLCMRRTYQFQPRSVGLSTFHRKFSCTRMYIPFQLSSVGLSAFHRKFSCMRHTYHGHLTILGLVQARSITPSHSVTTQSWKTVPHRSSSKIKLTSLAYSHTTVLLVPA